MSERRFEWDNDKATRSWLMHGVAFDHAIRAPLDPFAAEWIDEREDYGEERIDLLGHWDSVILHVTCVERGQNIRIISARRVERHEQDYCYRENSG